jgi:hypothetical protein
MDLQKDYQLRLEDLKENHLERLSKIDHELEREESNDKAAQM